MVTCKSAWPSGLRRCIQVAVYSCRRGFESHSWQFFIVLPSLTFDWQIKPARITFSRLKKHCDYNLLQASPGEKVSTLKPENVSAWCFLICTAPQMIPDRKWSPMWTASDPRRKTWNGMEFGFPDFFILIFVFIYLHQLNDELDKHKEKIFWQRKL